MEQLPEVNQTEHLKLLQQFKEICAHQIFNSDEKDIFFALKKPNIFNFPPNGFHNAMQILIGKTHLNCGVTLNNEQLKLTIDELCGDLKKDYGKLSFEEIEIAFKNGYKNEYGEYFGLNNKTYLGWVSAYSKEESRLRVIKAIQTAKEKDRQEPAKKTHAETAEIMKWAILTSFDQFKKGALIFDAGNVKYNYLVKIGLLNFTKERKVQILENVKLKLKQNAIETKLQSETLSKVLDKILPETEISEAKKESLKIYYKDLIDTGIEISDLLE